MAQPGVPRPAAWKDHRDALQAVAGDFGPREKAAAKAVEVLRENVAESGFRDEIHTSALAGRREDWYNQFTKVLAKRYEAGGIMSPVRAWRRWLRWRAAQIPQPNDHPAEPLAINLATWLEDEVARGPTVQQSLMAGLKLLRSHLGLDRLPLQSPLLAHLGAPTERPVERHADELPLKVWVHFGELAKRAEGVVALMAQLMLYVTVTTLRFRHAQRHRFLHHRCSGQMLVGEVSRGKVRRRAAFLVAAPTCLSTGDATFARMYDHLRREAPNCEFLIPDVETQRGQPLSDRSELVKRPMSYHKFMGVLRALAMAPPLSLDLEAARRLTSYSLRRKLPTVADRLRLPRERRAELGDWKDEVSLGTKEDKPLREPMAVRYSGARLRNSAETRMVCVLAIQEAAPGGDEESVRGAADRVPQFLSEAQRYLGGEEADDEPAHKSAKPCRTRGVAQKRGGGDSGGAEPSAAKKRNATKTKDSDAAAGESESSKSSTDASAELSEDGSEDTAPEDVCWMLPAGVKSKLHRSSGLTDQHGQLIPRCRHSAFAWGCEIGHGLAAAEATGREWHSRCYRSEG